MAKEKNDPDINRSDSKLRTMKGKDGTEVILDYPNLDYKTVARTVKKVLKDHKFFPKKGK